MTDRDGEGFARRWSRLKARSPVAAPPAAPPTAPPEPEEVPPALETLALEEIGPWLKRRVPELWKQAALRRIWLGDPAIRGFIGPADYAWDWNVPGGAPGYGPMRALDDLAALLDRAIGAKLPPEPPTPPQPPVAAPQIAAVEPMNLPEPAPDERVPEPLPPPLRRRGGGAAPV